MTGEDAALPPDLARLVVPLVGSVEETGDLWEPYRLLDPDGVAVSAVTDYLKDLQASGRSATTQRSYVLALLRWFRFLWVAGVAWEQATRAEARDFCRWLQVADKPVREHWRHRNAGERGSVPVPQSRAAGTVNPVTGKAAPGRRYSARTRMHSETVLRSFYDYHRDAVSGPIVNPFPVVRERRGGRAHAHHNPMDPYPAERGGSSF
jgi:hypothetical protein